jgi:hypothetical protein
MIPSTFESHLQLHIFLSSVNSRALECLVT